MSETQEMNTYGAPGMLSLMREAMGAAPLKQGDQAFGDVVTLSRQAVGGLSGKVWEGLTRRDEETGAGVGTLSYASDLAYRKVRVTFANMFRRRML